MYRTTKKILIIIVRNHHLLKKEHSICPEFIKVLNYKNKWGIVATKNQWVFWTVSVEIKKIKIIKNKISNHNSMIHNLFNKLQKIIIIKII